SRGCWRRPHRAPVPASQGRPSAGAWPLSWNHSTWYASGAPWLGACAARNSGVPMANARLISADSHVAISIDDVRARVPAKLREPFDDAMAEQRRIDTELRGGREMSLEDWDMEAFRDPGYREP